MTLVWLTLAFVAGCLFWHWLGGKFLRRFATNDNLRADVMKNLNDRTLLALRKSATEELQQRRHLLMKEGEL